MEGNLSNFNASLLMVYIFISVISSPEVYRLSFSHVNKETIGTSPGCFCFGPTVTGTTLESAAKESPTSANSPSSRKPVPTLSSDSRDQLLSAVP